MGSKEIKKINSVYVINIYILYYIIRAANKNNRNFNLLTTNKNFQRHIGSLKVNETIMQ